MSAMMCLNRVRAGAFLRFAYGVSRGLVVGPAWKVDRPLLEIACKVYALAGVLICTVLSGFFSLAGHALGSFSRVRLEEAFSGPGGRRRLARLERHLRALRLTASWCRVASNLGLVVAMVYVLGGPAAGAGRLVAAAAAGAGLIALFGVAIPHAWAAHAGERFLAACLGVLLAVRYALYPLVAAMQAFDLPIRRLTGLSDAQDENDESAKQEILQVATEGRAEGTVDAEEVQMIQSVMEFGETHVGEIMTPRTDIFALHVDTVLGEATGRIVEAGHTRVPVFQGDLDNIIGVLYAKDLLQRAEGSAPAKLRDIMRKPFFVPETKPLDDLLREFKNRKVHIAVVLDEYGGTAGLVTVEDLIEEIVGDISDEYDRAAPALMKAVDDKMAEVDGRLPVDDLNDAMGLAVPEDEDYDTVAGLVFFELGYIPKVGETLDAWGATFTVLEADARRITRLRVQRIGSRGASGGT